MLNNHTRDYLCPNLLSNGRMSWLLDYATIKLISVPAGLKLELELRLAIGLYFQNQNCLSTLVGPKKFLNHTPSSKKNKKKRSPKEYKGPEGG